MPNRNSEIPPELAGARSGSAACAHRDRTFPEPRAPVRFVPRPPNWITTGGSGTAERVRTPYRRQGAPGNLESWKTGVLDGRIAQVSRFPDLQVAAPDDAVTPNPQKRHGEPEPCKQIHEFTQPTSGCYARSPECMTGPFKRRGEETAMKGQITKISFENSVLASLAAVTVAPFGALLNAALNFQAFF
jgi:hypothetical protein